jgi:peroxiredoxin
MKRVSMLVLSLIACCVASAQDLPVGLEVKQMAPNFIAKDQNGKSINLKELLKSGQVVLVFYRGEWCPFCNKHLSALADSLSLITSKGAKLVAVTPQKSEYISKTIAKTRASYSIIHDDGLKIMKSYGVAFKLDDEKINLYKKVGIDFDVVNGETNGPSLPVPALYIIGKNGKITYRYFDHNYRNRPTVKEIVRNL